MINHNSIKQFNYVYPNYWISIRLTVPIPHSIVLEFSSFLSKSIRNFKYIKQSKLENVFMLMVFLIKIIFSNKFVETMTKAECTRSVRSISVIKFGLQAIAEKVGMSNSLHKLFLGHFLVNLVWNISVTCEKCLDKDEDKLKIF